jgi:hypothetical protein
MITANLEEKISRLHAATAGSVIPKLHPVTCGYVVSKSVDNHLSGADNCQSSVGIVGIPQPGRTHDRAFTWENASRTLYMRKKLNCPHAAPQESINEPNVYRALIPL